jgi:hypothetical protein
MTGGIRGDWHEVRDRTRLWCKIDPKRCLIEIVHRGVRKLVDLRAYGLAFVGEAALERESSLQGGPTPSPPAQATPSEQ